MNQGVPDLARRLCDVSTCLPLDAKRKPAHQTGVEAWFPYYAGYTERFARGVLDALGHDGRLRVLDPWNGAGTTTRVAHEMGHNAFGYDINPVATLVASAKIANADDAQHIMGLARRWARGRPAVVDPNDPLLPWLAPTVVAQYRGIESKLLDELATTAQGEVIRPLERALPPLASFLLLALIRTARDVARVSSGSNPTWTKPGEGRRKPMRNMGSRWMERVAEMADELAGVDGRTAVRPWSGTISIADSRNLSVKSESIDLALTSPPYCTRIDYVVSSSFELAALGLDPGTQAFGALRRATMGTPLARIGSAQDVPEMWPASVTGLLNAIRRHPSKSSKSYYYKTYWQYFNDAMKSLRELQRALRSGGVAVLVVQTSYYKDILVDLPELYVSMGEELGLRGTIVGEAKVRRAMAQINPHAARHRNGADYREAIVALEKVAA